jgi:hypothetical protein
MKPRYATPAKIKRAMDAARAGGMDVAGVDLGPDGTIRILAPSQIPADPYTKWLSEQGGKNGDTRRP